MQNILDPKIPNLIFFIKSFIHFYDKKQSRDEESQETMSLLVCEQNVMKFVAFSAIGSLLVYQCLYICHECANLGLEAVTFLFFG